MIFQDLLERFCRIMERKSDMADAPFRLHSLHKRKAARFLCLFHPCLVHGVKQIKVKISHAAARQLPLKDLAVVLHVLYQPHRHLVCEKEALSVITLHQTATHCLLRLLIVVRVCRVKIDKSLLHIAVNHPAEYRVVNLFAIAVCNGQPHTAKPKLLRHDLF